MCIRDSAYKDIIERYEYRFFNPADFTPRQEFIDSMLEEVSRKLHENPECMTALYYYGYLQALKGNYGKAEESYKKIMLLYPWHPGIARIYTRLGDMEFLKRNYKNAIGYYRRAIRRNSSLWEPYAKIGLIMEYRKEKKKALKYYKAAYRIKKIGWVKTRIDILGKELR